MATEDETRNLERAESLHDPIIFILTDHDRQRVIAASLERLANEPMGSSARDAAAYIRGYLLHELPTHIADEEEDLLPALARRVLPDDGFEALKRRIAEEHEADEAERTRLLALLEAVAQGCAGAGAPAFAEAARRFAAQMRRHLAWENSVILELARERLLPEDLAAIAHGMAERRGLLPPHPG